MTPNSAISVDRKCQRQFSDGRRCRMLRQLDHPALCPFHAREERQILESQDLAADLASLSGNLNNTIDINHALGKVFGALAQKRISPRTAATFGYLGQLLLQSIPGVKTEINRARDRYPEPYDSMVRNAIPFLQPPTR